MPRPLRTTRRLRTLGSLLACSLLTAALTAGGTAPAAAAVAPTAPTASGCPSAQGDWAAPGPFAVTVEPVGPAHTVYRPADLGSRGCGKHPVILWGNGTGAPVAVYGPLLRHLASHGFIVAAARTTWSGSGREMLAGIDHLARENGTPGSVYEGKVDLSEVGATGHSQGGGGALAAGANPRVDTTVAIEPGPQGSVRALRGPALFLAGQYDAVVAPWLLVHPRFRQTTHVPAVYGELAGATHLTPVSDGGGFRGPVTAWFRAQLLGDRQARAEFFGAHCGYCDGTADGSGGPWSAFERNAKAAETS
ncbi:acetylxylan esterase [Streptomyces sp. NPDC018045]|uniref:poly(ethylene terephthalate) hydrolase family protein n=1 Tax=Streptomyces sp. NPDC018045 TaxID=3365037 RepID=UPI00378C5C6D